MMKRRAYLVLLLILLPPMVALFPIWGIVWILTGKSVFIRYHNHLIDSQLASESD